MNKEEPTLLIREIKLKNNLSDGDLEKIIGLKKSTIRQHFKTNMFLEKHYKKLLFWCEKNKTLEEKINILIEQNNTIVEQNKEILNRSKT